MSKYMINSSGVPRNPRDFEYPKPPIIQRIIPRAIPPTWVSGLDISRYQTDGIVASFAQLKANGWQFIFIQATYGATGVDSKFDYFWRAAQGAGLWVIPYHFFYATYDGYVQADHFLRTTEACRNATGIQVGMVDVEARDGATVATRNTRLNNLWSGVRTKIKVITYSSPNLWQELTTNLRLNSADYGHVAHWTSANTPTLPVNWTSAQTKFWQRGVYTKHAWITQPPGVTEDVDVNSFMGTMDELKSFLNVSVTPPTPTPEHPHPEFADLYTKITALDSKVNTIASIVSLMSNTVLPKAKYVPTEDSVVSRIKGFNGVDNEQFDFYPTGSGEDVGKRIHITAPVEVLVEPYYAGDGGFKCYLIVDKTFLSTNKPTCPVFADASRGHLQAL